MLTPIVVESIDKETVSSFAWETRSWKSMDMTQCSLSLRARAIELHMVGSSRSIRDCDN